MRRGKLRVLGLLKSLVVPPRGQRILPTLTGYVLIIMAIALGMAAYNAASNILFIALSVLLSCLIVSGILSWINFHGICWRILTNPPCRVGEECYVRIEVMNTKKYLPTYALSFIVSCEGNQIKRIMRLGRRLDPQEVVRLDFSFTPTRRGKEKIRILGVVSNFPFGFLRKTLNGGLPKEVIVWPRRIPYHFEHAGASMAHLNGRVQVKPGHGSEFISLRAYRQGDSHRQVHWKASARLRSLVVQQYAAENHSGFIFSIQSYAKVWPDEEQFERFCGFASSLAEDLFREDRLHGIRINGTPLQRVARKADLEYVQDQLALLDRIETAEEHLTGPGHNVVTFEPNAVRGINAYVGGQKAATA